MRLVAWLELGADISNARLTYPRRREVRSWWKSPGHAYEAAIVATKAAGRAKLRLPSASESTGRQSIGWPAA